jgi:hypothetical protein
MHIINLQTPTRDWGKKKSMLKSMFPALVETDFVYDYGQKEAMMDNLQRKIGTSRSGLMELITALRRTKNITNNALAQTRF